MNSMEFRPAGTGEFGRIREFYWELIDLMADQNDRIGWKKGIYPTDGFLLESLSNGELYTLKDGDELCGCVILNSSYNEGYNGVPWSISCAGNDVLIPHALAVAPGRQGRGLGTLLVSEIISAARSCGKKTVRLDILGTNTAAERLYTRCGFRFVQAKTMFYEDTGWTEYRMFELVL